MDNIFESAKRALWYHLLESPRETMRREFVSKYEPRFGDGREEDWFAWLCKEKEEMAKGKSGKIHKVMGEYKRHTLHSGSKSGPVVKKRSQAVAIALNESRRGKK